MRARTLRTKSAVAEGGRRSVTEKAIIARAEVSESMVIERSSFHTCKRDPRHGREPPLEFVGKGGCTPVQERGCAPLDMMEEDSPQPVSGLIAPHTHSVWL